MAIEMLNYADLAARLKISPEAARSLAKRLRLPRSRGNDGKALVSVDLAEINHAPLPARSPAGHQVVTPLKAKIETLQAELAKLEAVAGGHRADFEWERDQGQKLRAEFLKMIAVTMTAKEATARLEGELAALKARPWWRRRVTSSLNIRRSQGACGTRRVRCQHLFRTLAAIRFSHVGGSQWRLNFQDDGCQSTQVGGNPARLCSRR